MNNKIKIIIGDIEFFNNLAVVNRVDGIIYCNSIQNLGKTLRILLMMKNVHMILNGIKCNLTNLFVV